MKSWWQGLTFSITPGGLATFNILSQIIHSWKGLSQLLSWLQADTLAAMLNDGFFQPIHPESGYESSKLCLVFRANPGTITYTKGLSVAWASIQGGLWLASTTVVMEREGIHMTDIPALPGFPVTLFGGNGFLRGGVGLGGKGGRRVPGIMAKILYYR